MVHDLNESLRKTLVELVAAIDSSVPAGEDIAILRKSYDRAVQKEGRAKVGEVLGLPVGEVDSLSRVLRRATDVAISTDRDTADGQIAVLRFLLFVEHISQAKPGIIPTPLLPTETDEVFARKQLRALELVLRALINEQYRKQDLLIQRLEALFKTEIVEKWRKIADPDDVLSGTLLSELAGIFTHKEEFPKYRPVYETSSALTFMADKRQTIRTFLEDIRDLRNRVAHHKPLTVIQINLLDLYYHQIVKPVQDLCDRGGTKVNPESIMDADASTIDNYFSKLQDDLRSIDDRTSEIARDVSQIRKGVNVIQGETKGLHKRTKLILASASAAVMLTVVSVWQLGLIGRKTDTISTQVAGSKKEVSKDPRKELANMGIQWKIDEFVGALRQGDRKAITLFLDGGMSPNNEVIIIGRKNRPISEGPIVHYIIKNNYPDLEWVLKQFISHGFDINKDISMWFYDYIEASPLVFALRVRVVDRYYPESTENTISCLINCGADINGAVKKLNEIINKLRGARYDNERKSILECIRIVKELQRKAS